MPDDKDKKDKKDKENKEDKNTSFSAESDSTEQRSSDSPGQGRRDIGGFVPTS